jgi:hypothetical protein
MIFIYFFSDFYFAFRVDLREFLENVVWQVVVVVVDRESQN